MSFSFFLLALLVIFYLISVNNNGATHDERNRRRGEIREVKEGGGEVFVPMSDGEYEAV